MINEQAKARIIEAMNKVPPDILTVIEERGLRYNESATIKGSSAIVIPKSGDTRPIIEVRASDSPQAKMFAAAYELMRWILAHERIRDQSKGRKNPGGSHKPVRHDTAPVSDRGDVDPSTGLAVARLHKLAGELLVPIESLSRVLASNNNDIRKTAEEFRTSEEAIVMRMRSIRPS